MTRQFGMNTRFTFDETLLTLARAFARKGFELFAVGGHVRNTLLSLPISDTDITSAMRPDEVKTLCAEMGLSTVDKGIKFGMVEIHTGGNSYEHTTFRADKYAEGGAHRPQAIAFADTVEEDAFRRDFTVNALYCGVLTGNITDPTGGLEDIKDRVIKSTSPDPKAILSDDGLRLLRLCRFAAELGFDIEAGTYAAAKQCAPLLADISGERVRDELNKILLSDKKYGIPADESVLRGLRLIDELRLVDVIIPELVPCRGMRQSPKFHKYPVLEHIIVTASMAEDEGLENDKTALLNVRLACLLHDVAKPVVFAEQGNMHGHDERGEIISREILRRLKYDNQTIDIVTWLVRQHMFDIDGNAKEPTLKKRFCVWGEEKVRLLAAVRRADFRGSVGERIAVKSADRWIRVLKEMQAQGAPFSEDELACTGADIMEWLNEPPSKKIGKIKHAMLLHCACRPQDNTKEKLNKLVNDMKNME